jgi:hypoxanthine phosphoribosyltransferase
MSDLYISWPEYHQKIEQLAFKVYQSNWPFNQIICLARGGLRVGDIFSRIFRQPLAILATSSYTGSEGRTQETLAIAHNMTMTTSTLGSHILLVDDLVDSGITLQETVIWLNEKYPVDIQEIRTAVLWWKACSIVQPDYYVDYLVDNPWIHQPFEKYETINPEDLAASS